MRYIKLFESFELNDNFWLWFGKSITIENGKPILFSHGTDNDFTTFDLKYKSSNRVNNIAGFYFMNARHENNYGKNIIKCYLKLENPYDDRKTILPRNAYNVSVEFLRAKKQFNDDYIISKCNQIKNHNTFPSVFSGEEIREILIRLGYDGYISGDFNYGEITVFHPNQIKSINNNGDWDIKNDDIYL